MRESQEARQLECEDKTEAERIRVAALERNAKQIAEERSRETEENFEMELS